VALDLVHVGVADHAHGLARVASRDGRVLVADLGDALLVEFVGARLVGGDEARPHPHALRAERERRREPPAVHDGAGGQHGDVDGIHDLGHQGEGRHAPGVSARLGALGHHHVAARALGRHGVAHLSTQAHHQQARLVAALDHGSRDAEPGDEGAGAAFDDHVDGGQHLVRQGGEQVHAERLVRQPAHLLHLLADALRWLRRHAERAEAARFGDRGADPRVGDAAHAGQEDRVLDAEAVADRGAE
jgi:hypothetical protein